MGPPSKGLKVYFLKEEVIIYSPPLNILLRAKEGIRKRLILLYIKYWRHSKNRVVKLKNEQAERSFIRGLTQSLFWVFETMIVTTCWLCMSFWTSLRVKNLSSACSARTYWEQTFDRIWKKLDKEEDHYTFLFPANKKAGRSLQQSSGFNQSKHKKRNRKAPGMNFWSRQWEHALNSQHRLSLSWSGMSPPEPNMEHSLSWLCKRSRFLVYWNDLFVHYWLCP